MLMHAFTVRTAEDLYFRSRAFYVRNNGVRPSVGPQQTYYQPIRAYSAKSESILFLDWRVRSVAETAAARC